MLWWGLTQIFICQSQQNLFHKEGRGNLSNTLLGVKAAGRAHLNIAPQFCVASADTPESAGSQSADEGGRGQRSPGKRAEKELLSTPGQLLPEGHGEPRSSPRGRPPQPLPACGCAKRRTHLRGGSDWPLTAPGTHPTAAAAAGGGAGGCCPPSPAAAGGAGRATAATAAAGGGTEPGRGAGWAPTPCWAQHGSAPRGPSGADAGAGRAAAPLAAPLAAPPLRQGGRRAERGTGRRGCGRAPPEPVLFSAPASAGQQERTGGCRGHGGSSGFVVRLGHAVFLGHKSPVTAAMPWDHLSPPKVHCGDSVQNGMSHPNERPMKWYPQAASVSPANRPLVQEWRHLSDIATGIEKLPWLDSVIIIAMDLPHTFCFEGDDKTYF